MLENAEKLYDNTKQSLEALLREKAYSEVKEVLESKGIDISCISDEDIEALVAAKAQDMMSTLKGIGIGAAFVTALSFFMGGF